MELDVVKKLLPDAEKHGNFVRETWDRLVRAPLGAQVFSRLVGTAAPYTGSINATVVDLRKGYSRVELRDRRAVRNHLRCVHAIALANLAELCANSAVAYSLPDDARFIVAGFSIEYLKKARGTITAECDAPTVTSNEKREYSVPVTMKDASGQIVATATFRTLVGPKKT